MAAPVKSPRVVQRVETNTGAVHSFSESEVRAYIEYFNSSLSDDPTLKNVIPLDPANKARFFEVVKDGLLFVKLINKFFPGTVDETKVKPVPKNTFEQSINIDFGLAAAKQIGCSVVNIGASVRSSAFSLAGSSSLFLLLQLSFYHCPLSRPPGMVQD